MNIEDIQNNIGKREIKFRAWNKKTNTMMYPQGFHQQIVDHSGNGNAVFSLYGNGFLDDRIYQGNKTDVVLMQYTGLKDKNGVEIYEGDIVRILYTDWASKSDSDERTLEQYKKDISSIGVVAFEDAEFGLKIYIDFLDSLFEGRHGEKVVIGNIFENPELLS